ncbi:calmodulin-regulated spectrin-associated protein 1-B-like [Branchiostoma floridae x Branchiostoma japonicum]
MSESVRNLSLVRRFCDQHLGAMFHLSYEDVLYSPEVLKPNIKAFIAELFWWLEVIRPDIVQPALTNHQQTIPLEAEMSSTPTRARPRPNIPISKATKRSFQTPDRDSPSNLSITPSHSSPDISRHTPLLALRHRAKQNSQQGEGLNSQHGEGEEVLHPLRRSNSLNSASDASVKGSVMAWPEVANSNGGLPRPGHVGHESQHDIDLESVSSRPESRSDRADSSMASQDSQAPREPLMPAVLRPSKEKSNACKKEDELGEGPDKSVTKIDRTGRLRHTVVSSDMDTMDQITPISESVSSFSLSSASDVVMGSQGDSDSTISSESCSANRPGGFYLAPVSSAMSYDTTDRPDGRPIPASVGKSYTVAENMYTTESAQAAGIPIIDDNVVGRASVDEEGNPGNAEDAGDVVESPKLHSETLDKESLQKESFPRESLPRESFQKESIPRESLQMDFLQRDHSVPIQTWGKGDKNCNNGNGVPTATTPQEVKVATSGHVTTWGRNRASRGSTPEEQENGHGTQPLASQMVKLRLKLEEKRRTIENEKKKMELQWNRQRQRVGKAAFLHVISQKKAPTPTKEPPPENYHYDRGDNNGRIRFDKNEVSAPCMTGFASANSAIPEEVVTEVNREPAFAPKQSHDIPMSPNEATSPGEVIDLNEYNTSLERLNSDLSLIQKEIARLSQHQDTLKSQSSPPAKERVPSSPRVKPVVSKSSPKSKEKNVSSTPKLTHANVAGTVSIPSSVSSNQSRSSKKQQGRVTAMEASPTIEHVQHRRLAASQSDQTLGLGSSGPQFEAEIPRSESEQGRTTSHVDHENSVENVQTTYDSTVEQWAMTGKVCKPEDSREEAVLPESPGAEGKAAAVGFFSFNSADADKTKEEEMSRKREQFLRARMKREEQLKARQMEREAEQEREREERKRRQEEAEQRKAEEKARKELIYQEYQRRKHEQEMAQQQQRKGARPKKSRPKSGPPVDTHKGSSSGLFVCLFVYLLEYQRRKHEQDIAQQQQRKGARPKKSRPKSGPPADTHKGSSSGLFVCLFVCLLEYQRRKHQQEMQQQQQRKGARPKKSRPKSGPPVDTHKGSSSGGSRPASVVESHDGTSGSSGSGRKTPDWEQSSQSSTSEYTGPKLFVKPSTKSNRHIIINALKDCCLAGEVNNQVKGKVLEALAMSESFHYVILFRDARCQFRAVYSYNPENEKIHKLVGNGPSSIQGKMINSLYKYNSGGKQFVGIPSKTMSVSVDALTIHNHLWQSKKSGK